MKAMIATQWGEPSEMQYAEVADPTPGPGQVLIDVKAIGCNFPDILIVQGKYQMKPPLPFSPGHEVAGIVLAVGAGVTRVHQGQRVFAMIELGAYAERAVADGTRQCIAFEGRLLVVGFAGGRIPSIAANRILLKNMSVVGVHWGMYQTLGSPLVDQWMSALLTMHGKGQIWPVIYKTYPLADAAKALAAIAARESYGKVVLIP